METAQFWKGQFEVSSKRFLSSLNSTNIRINDFEMKTLPIESSVNVSTRKIKQKELQSLID
jgi:hypothetical protein